MTNDELINHIQEIINFIEKNLLGGFAQAKEFLLTFGGEKNQFYVALNAIPWYDIKSYKPDVIEILNSYKEYINKGIMRGISLEREIQIETVSDFLEQANSLLNDKKVHPAAATVIIGASLEEFLRNWLEQENCDFSKFSNTIDGFAKELRRLEKINKQDLKDITSWAGTRNDAAHGHWENVEDRLRIRLMLEGVNLFIRKYTVNL